MNPELAIADRVARVMLGKAGLYDGYIWDFNRAIEPVTRRMDAPGVIHFNDLIFRDLEMTIPIKTYAAMWTEDNAPTPEELAQQCLLVTEHILGGHDPQQWYKPLGCAMVCSPTPLATGLPIPPVGQLVVRQPWKCEIVAEFETCERLMRVAARFGLWRNDGQD